MNFVVRSSPLWRAGLRAPVASRFYATQSSSSSGPSTSNRKAVTILNDDGRVSWTNLSMKEKAARTTQQTINFGLVLLGLVLTGGVGYVMFTEVFSPDSTTTEFNRAVDRVKNDSQCLELLGDKKHIKAYGEPSLNKWATARPIASNVKKDTRGVEHMIMHFNVEGNRNKGVVRLHKTKGPSDTEWDYRYLFMDVPGQRRIYLENADTSADPSKRSKTKFFGFEFGR